MIKLGLIGNGFVGGAARQLGCQENIVCVYDIDPEKCMPKGTTLESVAACDLIFVAVPTPSRKDGTCHIDIVVSVVAALKKANAEANIVIRSTVPPGTSKSLGTNFMPEFLTELMHLNAEKCLTQAGNARAPGETRQKRIERYAELRGLTLQHVQTALETMPMDGNREFIPPVLRQQQENEFISDMLNVPENTFGLRPLIKENEVTYASRANSTKEKFALTSALHIPDTGGYDWHFSGLREFETRFFSYIYNYGDNTVSFNEVSVGTGASIVVKPFTHVRVTPQGDARLVVVHVGGWVSEQLLNEMSTFATEGRQRITSNSTKWW